MKIAVACKILPDSQDVLVRENGELDSSKAPRVVSEYDLNALEIAAQLAATEGASVVAVSVGGADIDESKTKKNILARGADELLMTADDTCSDLDAYSTAAALASLLGRVGECDLILCGDGSADNYAQQVDVQLAALLGLPVVTAVSKVEVRGSILHIERTLEDAIEAVEVDMPCVVSVSPEIAVPRIPGMKDILAAGKKPMHMVVSEDIGKRTVETVSCKAPDRVERKLEIRDISEDGAIETFAAALKAAL